MKSLEIGKTEQELRKVRNTTQTFTLRKHARIQIAARTYTTYILDVHFNVAGQKSVTFARCCCENVVNVTPTQYTAGTCMLTSDIFVIFLASHSAKQLIIPYRCSVFLHAVNFFPVALKLAPL